MLNNLGAANYFWVGGSGDWSDVSNWATTKGGPVLHTILPGTNDVVYVYDSVTVSSDTAWCYDLNNNGVLLQTGGIIIVFGDLGNDSVINQSGGRIIMGGSGSDSIKGKYELYLDSLELNKNGYLQVTRKTTINKHMNLFRGYLITDPTQELLFDSLATCNGGNDTSFSLGPVSKYGNTAFNFPVGFGNSWARLGISDGQLSNQKAKFKAQYIRFMHFDTGSYLSPISKVSSVEYWFLDKISGDGSYKVKLFFEDDGISGIQNPDSALVIKYISGDWVSVGNSGYSFSGYDGYIESDFVATFSPFTFGTLSNWNTLPVHFLKFDARRAANQTFLTWTTSNEKENSHFEVERSFDNLHFQKIDIIMGNKMPMAINNYSFCDSSILMGSMPIIYYRIKQIDKNGEFSYSKVRALHATGKPLSFSPNPVSSSISFSRILINAQLRLLDASGSKVWLKENFTGKLLDLTEINRGFYTLRIQEGNNVLTYKLFKS